MSAVRDVLCVLCSVAARTEVSEGSLGRIVRLHDAAKVVGDIARVGAEARLRDGCPRVRSDQREGEYDGLKAAHCMQRKRPAARRRFCTDVPAARRICTDQNGGRHPNKRVYSSSLGR